MPASEYRWQWPRLRVTITARVPPGTVFDQVVIRTENPSQLTRASMSESGRCTGPESGRRAGGSESVQVAIMIALVPRPGSSRFPRVGP